MATEDGEPAPNATIYIRNINERIKIPKLKTTLHELFGEFGNIVDVVAKANVKAKGQAFIVYDDVESAQEAIEEMNNFDMLGRELEVTFARARSDQTVEREDGEAALEVHKKHRLAEKERKQAIEAQNQKPTAKRRADSSLAERPAKTSKPTTASGAVPDEYLPPNKILFVRDAPHDYGKEDLAAIFRRFTGFKEVRTVPGRKGIAFVEYEDENGAITAKESTAGMTLGEATIRVTFQRQ